MQDIEETISEKIGVSVGFVIVMGLVMFAWVMVSNH
jgi:hypothetical protein